MDNTRQQELFKEIDALASDELKIKILEVIHPNYKPDSLEVEFFKLSQIVENHMRVMNANAEWFKVKKDEFAVHYEGWSKQHERTVISKYEEGLRNLTLGELADRIVHIED